MHNQYDRIPIQNERKIIDLVPKHSCWSAHRVYHCFLSPCLDKGGKPSPTTSITTFRNNAFLSFRFSSVLLSSDFSSLFLPERIP